MTRRHARKIDAKGQVVPKLEWKQTNGRTDTTELLPFPLKAIGSGRARVVEFINSTTRARPDQRGPARTLSETRTDPTEFLGDPGRKKSPCGSGRARVVEFSYNAVSDETSAS